MRITNMRQVLGGVAALALSVVSVANVFAEGPHDRAVAADVRVAATAAIGKKAEPGLSDLLKAANRGEIDASMRVAQIYDNGKLVARNRQKACEIYSSIADRNEKIDHFSPFAPLVAEAFRRYADCYAEGLDAPGWKKNMRAAADLYFHAGVILRDPESLFELAKLYLHGEAIAQNTAMAVHLLDSAARKRYPPAQALLGSMMWGGKVMKKREAPGLALLTLARERATAKNQAWIRTLYDDAMITASKEIEEEALLLVEKWKDVHGAETLTASTQPQPSIPSPIKSPTRQFKGIEFAGEKDRFQNQTTNTTTPLDTTGSSDK